MTPERADRGDVVPIPGTKRVERLEENVAAASLRLDDRRPAALGAVAAPLGDRYADMRPLNR